MTTTLARSTALCLTLAAAVHAQTVISTLAGTDWVFPTSSIAASNAPLGNLLGVAVDRAGNIFGGDCDNHIIYKIDPAGLLTLVAGNGFDGISDDGPAAGSTLSCPKALTFDRAGNLLFIDADRIRQLTPDGRLLNLAGGGNSTVEGAPAKQTDLQPDGLAVDTAGNLYYSENNRIRRITSDGLVRTFAGTGQSGFSGDNGPALRAQFNRPTGLTFAPNGTLYVCDTDNNRLRAIASDGVIRTIAGTGLDTGGADGLPAVNARFYNPREILVEADGSLLFSLSSSTVFRISPGGVLSTIAGPQFGFAGDGGPATAAAIGTITGIAKDAAGNLLIVDQDAFRLRRVDATGRINSIAGNGKWRRTPDVSDPLSAWLYYPRSLAISPAGLVTFSDAFDYGTVRQIAANGRLVRLAGIRPGEIDGPLAVNAYLNGGGQVAFDARGNLYVLGQYRCVLFRISPDGGFARIAGDESCRFNGDGGPATQAAFNQPEGVAVNSAGDIFIADTANHRIRRISSDGIIRTIAGTGQAGFSGDGGPALRATLNDPTDLLTDAAGNLYISEAGNSRVRRIAADGTISTVAGNGRRAFSGDNGTATQASLAVPRGLALDSAGNLYIADSENNRIRVVSPAGVIRTIAGNGLSAFSGDGGAPLEASLQSPSGVAIDKDGRLYIADFDNARIRVIQPATSPFNVSPATVSFTVNTAGEAAPVDVNLSSTIAGLAYRATTSATWLTVSPATGTLPSALQLSVNPTGLAPGQYTATLTVNVPLATPSSRQTTVTLTVPGTQPPRLGIGSGSVSFQFQQGEEPTTKALTISNLGGGSLTYTATARATSGGNWLTLTPTTGQLTAGANANISLTATPGSLGQGTYSAVVTITDGAISRTLPVTMSIAGRQGKLLLSQTGLTFLAVTGGGAPLPQSFGVLNEGAGAITYDAKATTLAGGSWLKLNNATGRINLPLQDVAFVEAIADARGLAPGDYYAEIRVTSPGLPPQLVTALLKVLPAGANPGPELSPSGLVFVGTPGTTPPSQDVQIANLQGQSIRYTSSSLTFDGAKWISHLPTTATVDPDQPRRLVVRAQFAGLTPGVKRGALYLLFEDGTSRTVSILSVIPATTPAPQKANERRAVGCNSPLLRSEFLTLAEGAPVTIGQPVSLQVKVVDDCGNLLLGTEKGANSTVLTRFSNGDPDLRLIPIGSGVWSATWRPTNPSANVTISAVSVFAAGLSLQTLQAGRTDRTVRLAGGANAPQVGAGALVQSASQRGDSPVAPGTLITIYGSNLAGAPQQSSVPLPIEVDGTQVLLGGQPLPILFSSAGQINAQVPYNLPVNTSHQVVVRRGVALSVPEPFNVASAQPGIFTTNQQGTGQGIVLGPDQLTLADPAKPAQRNQAIIIYCTGLGAVTPEVTLGGPAPGGPLATTVNPVAVQLGDQAAQVLFSGLTPGFTGLYQVNALVPANAPVGDAVPLTISTSGQLSNTVTIALR